MKRNFPFNIRQVAEILDLKIRYENHGNGNVDVDCPFCEKKSKMNINAKKNVFRCCICGVNGGMLELYSKINKISNAEAYGEICEILKCDKSISAESGNHSSQLPCHAGSDAIHQSNSMLLSLLTLADPHKDFLLSRGLSPEQIARFNYKSVPAFGQKQLCTKLLESGCVLEGVPGFYLDHGEWNIKPRAPGILIPVRGIDGKIAGMQIRLNQPINKREYIWFSSPDLDGGVSSGAPIHFIGDPAAKRIYVTDGILKGTVSHVITGYTFVCLPGANGLKGLDELLLCLKANGAVEAVEVFNMTKLTDKQTGESAANLREKLSANGLTVTSAIWDDTSHISVDDYYLNRINAKRSQYYNVDIPA